MKYYQLLIESKIEKSEEEIERDKRGYNTYGMNQAGIDLQRYKTDRVLNVELSEEEFAKIKNAVIKEFV